MSSNTPHEPFRVAIVGCGKIATRFHAPAFARLPGCRIVAACDVAIENARALGDRYGVPVFTEKPLAGAAGQYHIQDTDLPAARAAVDAWLRAGVRFGVNLALRHDLAAGELKRAVAAEELGTPVAVCVDHALGSANHI